jgi:hypothetical protein
MPKRRKSDECVSELAVLLRDAQPTWSEIYGERNARKRNERTRAQELAQDKLLKMYWVAKKYQAIARLDIRVRNFCERLKDRNRGVMPKPKGGRPSDVHRRFLLAVEVQEARDARGRRKYGSLEQALQEVREQRKISYDYVKDSYYGRGARFAFIPVKEWRLAVKAEVARRKYEAVGCPRNGGGTVNKSAKG